MNTLTWVLAGVAVYWVVVAYLDRGGYLPEYVGTQGPITTLHTKRGRIFLDKLARPKRFWRAWSNAGLGVALVLMVGSFFALLLAAVSSIQNPQPSPVNEPRNVLVIPGVNDFLPLSVAWEIVFGLLVGLVVHEGGHGLLCRVEDIDIESMGLALFTIIPIGAFVEPDEESQRRADRGGKSRMFAAGVTNNFAVTLLVFALLFGPVVGSIGVAQGAAITGALPDSPADRAGIGQGDRITAIDGDPIESNGDLQATLDSLPDREVTVTVDDGDESRTVPVNRSVLVVGVSLRGPVNASKGARVTSVGGERIYTQSAFESAIEAAGENATIGIDGEYESTFPVGAYAVVAPDGPMANATAFEGGDRVVITHVGDTRVRSNADVSAVLDDTSPGEEISLTLYRGENFDRRGTVSFALGSTQGSDIGHVGILVQPGVSGLVVNDFGVRTYPAAQYLGLLGGGDLSIPLVNSFFGKIVIALFLPLAGAGMLPVPYNFAGFTPDIVNFYTAQGSLAFLGAGVFTLANTLFWVGWINIQLGFFNCIPAFPLDGGRILRASTEAVVSRLPISADHELTRTVTTSVGLAMLLSFLAMVFLPSLLAGG